MKLARLSIALLVGVLLCALFQWDISPVFAEKIGGQSPVLVVAPHYLGDLSSSVGYKALPGVPVYLTPDGYPVMRTERGEWVYMVNPEAVQIPGPQITVVTVQGMPIQSHGYFTRYFPPQGLGCNESTSEASAKVQEKPLDLQGYQTCYPQEPLCGGGIQSCFILPPVEGGKHVMYYPVGYGGFVVLPCTDLP